MFARVIRAAHAAAALSTLLVTQHAFAQSNIVGYGVTANGALFRFDPDAPASATTIGNLGIVPEAIDFRPTTIAGDPNRPLYAIDIGPVTTQLYTVNTATAAVTPVGPGFASMTAEYNLVDQQYGFDFNPVTLMVDNSIRIRLTSTNGVNLRLNSDTGLVTAVDTPLEYADMSAPFADASAYINSDKARMPADGTTTLFAMDSRPDRLSIQNPPNAGTLNVVGAFGVTVDAQSGIAFDIWTDPANTDPSVAGDRAFAAFRRTEVSGGNYLLYDVDLSTGQTTNGRLVGGGLDFTGGMAFTYAVPEPASWALAALAMTLQLEFARRKRM